MKYAEYNIDNNKMEFFNTILGVETIKVHGKEVSKGFSWFGRRHEFKIGENLYRLTSGISLRHITGVAFSISKNNIPLQVENSISTSEKRNLILKIAVLFPCALVSGLFFGDVIIDLLYAFTNMF